MYNSNDYLALIDMHMKPTSIYTCSHEGEQQESKHKGTKQNPSLRSEYSW